MGDEIMELLLFLTSLIVIVCLIMGISSTKKYYKFKEEKLNFEKEKFNLDKEKFNLEKEKLNLEKKRLELEELKI